MPTSERPLCQCHGKPMVWNKDPRTKAGGFWRCLVKKIQSNIEPNKRYRQTEKGRATQNASNRRSARRKQDEADQKTVNRILAENPWLEEFMNDGKTVGTERRERAVA